jgi:uncharacterized protein YkwD
MALLPTPSSIQAAALLVLTCCTACLGPDVTPPRPEAEPVPSRSTVGSSNRPLSIRLQGNPAAVYSADPGTVLETPLARRIHSRFPQLRLDPCLQRAAAAYLQVDPNLHAVLPLTFAEFALHWAGCPDATATVSRLYTSEDGNDVLLRHLEKLLLHEEYTHAGLARSAAAPPYRSQWLVMLAGRRFSMQPFPTAGDPGAVLPLLFRVDSEFEQVAVAITGTGGQVDFVEVGKSDGWVVTGVPLEDRVGSQWIELLGYGPRGPQVLALFPVSVGRPPASSWVGNPRGDESWIADIGQAETYAAELLARDRARFGLPSLTRDPRLDAVARAHSKEMASSGYFGHVSPVTGSIVDRLASIDYTAGFAAENIAMGASLAEAQEGLMRSPGHRATLLSTDATHFGIGVARDDRDDVGPVYVLTQVFASPFPTIRAPRHGQDATP